MNEDFIKMKTFVKQLLIKPLHHKITLRKLCVKHADSFYLSHTTRCSVNATRAVRHVADKSLRVNRSEAEPKLQLCQNKWFNTF